jgi:peptidoglycan/LPS O-acetylase OafA/YrhL
MACTVFLWFEKHADLFCRLPEKLDGFVSFVSRYSFSIYLIHAMVLSELVGTRMGITIYWSNYIIASAVRIFLVFVLSLLFSIIVDQVLTKPLQKIASKVL